MVLAGGRRLGREPVAAGRQVEGAVGEGERAAVVLLVLLAQRLELLEPRFATCVQLPGFHGGQELGVAGG
ncbi:hypothetical protein ABZW47_31470, partial [Streptomyces sp. NPDC004549]|uniref:hypothetical protein n=1 Tax=Streptomyces sp. NPDC004549 TaxID=3154283 RepID=UPI0033B17AB7